MVTLRYSKPRILHLPAPDVAPSKWLALGVGPDIYREFHKLPLSRCPSCKKKPELQQLRHALPNVQASQRLLLGPGCSRECRYGPSECYLGPYRTLASNRSTVDPGCGGGAHGSDRNLGTASVGRGRIRSCQNFFSFRKLHGRWPNPTKHTWFA